MDVKQAFTELGLTLQASQADAKQAYRSLAMRWHPDISGGVESETRMKSINVAYALVSQHLDAQEKAQARLRASVAAAAKTAATARGSASFQAWARSRADPPNGAFAEFDSKAGFQPDRPARPAFAHTQPQAQAPAQPQPHAQGKAHVHVHAPLLQRTLQVSLFEAAFGCVKRVCGMEPVACTHCGGSGEFAGTWTMGAKCMDCFGRGLSLQPGGSVLRCVACKGSGVFKTAPPPCSVCKGSGRVDRRAWMVDVQVHAGTLDSCVVQAADIRVRAGLTFAPRDFRFKVQLEKHPLFKLDGDRLSVQVPVSFWRWTLGGELMVPTLDGCTRVSLANRPSGLLVPNQGWPQPGEPKRRKPLFVLPRIIYPTRLDNGDRQLLRMLDARDKLPEVEGWKRNVQAWLEASEPGAA